MPNVKVNVREIEALNYLFERVMGKIFLSPYSNPEVNEMTGAQKRIMYFLDQEGTKKMSEVARLVSVTLPAATAVVDKLVRAGVVRRINDARDRRVVYIELTDAGQKTMKRIKVVHERRLREVFEKLETPKRQQLLLAFETIHVLLSEIDLKGNSA